jgi:Astacin (Peptidase family M12A)
MSRSIIFILFVLLSFCCRRKNKSIIQRFYGENSSAIFSDSIDIKIAEKNYKVNFSIYDSMSIVEGDIQIYTPASEKNFTLLGNIEYGKIWKSNTIPYELSNGLPQGIRENISNAMAHWTEKTGIVFKSHTNEVDYILFEKGTTSSVGSSLVGCVGGMQKIKLGSKTSAAVAIHEIGHSLGLWHEQSRVDRDIYVEILYKNISRSGLKNFGKWGNAFGEYDFNSRMHYLPRTFSRNGKETIKSRIPGKEIKNDGYLSQGDIAAIKYLYKL